MPERGIWLARPNPSVGYHLLNSTHPQDSPKLKRFEGSWADLIAKHSGSCVIVRDVGSMSWATNAFANEKMSSETPSFEDVPAHFEEEMERGPGEESGPSVPSREVERTNAPS